MIIRILNVYVCVYIYIYINIIERERIVRNTNLLLPLLPLHDPREGMKQGVEKRGQKEVYGVWPHPHR